MHMELANYLVGKLQTRSRQQDRLSRLCRILPPYLDELFRNSVQPAEKLLLFMEITRGCASHDIGTVCALCSSLGVPL